MSKYDEAVAKGIALLDQKTPDWRSKVDLTTLDLSSACDCVLGQVFGSFSEGKAALDIDGRAAEFGFACDATGWDCECVTVLEPVWREVLA